jgi:hypothetical protein
LEACGTAPEELRELNLEERLRLREELWNMFVDDEAPFAVPQEHLDGLCAAFTYQRLWTYRE